MAPHRPSVKRQKTAPSDSEDKPLPSTFDPVAEDMVKKARNVLSAGEKHRALKRKSIEEKHDKAMKDASARINSLFETRKHRVAKLQASQWEKLDGLNKRRMHLESLILSAIRSMERHTMNISSELSAMFEGRIEEIQGSPVARKA